MTWTRIFLLFFLLVFELINAQQDSSHYIKVNFLYGSKPKRKYKSTEFKAFGGIHGGHVSIQSGTLDYGFEPTIKHVHVFSRRNRKSDFVDRDLKDQNRYSPENKTVTFIIPLNTEQNTKLIQLLKCYADTVPYDYAFFGMRCASTTQDLLSQVGILKKKNRFFTLVTTFYPKRLRKRMFKLARKNKYIFIKTEGKLTRR